MSPVEKIPHEVPSDATLREDMMRQLPEHRLDPVIGSPSLRPHRDIFAKHMVKLFASNSVLIPPCFFSRYEDLVMTGLDEMDAGVSSLRMEFKNREMKFILIPFQHKHRLVAITVDCVRNIATHFGLSAPDDLTHAKELVDNMYEQLRHWKSLTWYCLGPLVSVLSIDILILAEVILQELKNLPPLTANDQALLVSHVLQRVTLSKGDITIEDLHSEFVHSVGRIKEAKA
ncbi:hypothetical protein BCR39DRAFT_53389 [Naematelia encephala]|uniref:Uncharacterized protein n=1 Tax=Naematelia encephala TaxID=71784 RepID=A0A1Y2AGT6_9TREE|nr:hypothetical protein BCR39DRAFT_53389 [Naematelia encephala]